MTSVRRYVWRRLDGQISKPHTLFALRIVAARRIIWGKGPYNLRQDGKLVGRGLTRPAAIKRFINLVRSRQVGSTFRVLDSPKRDGKVGLRLLARAVLINLLPTDSTNGNRKADAYYNWVVSNYKQYRPRYAGSYVCKTISGTWQLSQHSYGNAVDFFFDSSSHQSVVASAVVANAAMLNAYHVISHQSVWTKGFGWSTYHGDYHSHLHVDFDPQLSGHCGVRN